MSRNAPSKPYEKTTMALIRKLNGEDVRREMLIILRRLSGCTLEQGINADEVHRLAKQAGALLDRMAS